MIEHASGNLLEADVEGLVNSVNMVGVMGKGIALQFKQAYPANYESYRKACQRGEVKPGHIHVFETGLLTNPRFILNFPTKRHWKSRSRIGDIDAGLAALVEVVRRLSIRSVAIPPLGCGNGGLAWRDVLPRIERAFEPLPAVHVLVFAPGGSPAPERMPVATKMPRMTPTRAALLSLLGAYAIPGYRVTMLEVQKLAYFLQMAGEPMKLAFERGPYGPYAEALHFVLQRLEGHYVRGYGDRSQDITISVLDTNPPAIRDLLLSHDDTRERLQRVARLIEGFETPYGLELLATVHRVAHDSPAAQRAVSAAIEGVQSWSERKRKRFSPQHISRAWSHLQNHGWL